MENTNAHTKFSVCDIKLNKITNPSLLSSLNDQNRIISQIMHTASIVQNYVVTNLANNKDEIMKFDRDFIWATINSVSYLNKESKKSKKPFYPINNIKKQFREPLKCINNLNLPNFCRYYCSDLMEVLINDNVLHNIKLSFATNFHDIQKAYILVTLCKQMNDANVDLSKKCLFNLSGIIATFVNNTNNKSFNYKFYGLFFDFHQNKLNNKWTYLKRTLYKLSNNDKYKVMLILEHIISCNMYSVMLSLNKINNKGVIKTKLTVATIKQYPHIVVDYMNKINKYYENNKHVKDINISNKINKFTYTANKMDYLNNRPNKIHKNKLKPINDSKDEIINNNDFIDEDTFKNYSYYKKFMKCRNILPLRSGASCFISISNGDRLNNVINYYFNVSKLTELKVRSIYEPIDQNEERCIKLIKLIHNKLVTMLRDTKEHNYDNNKKELVKSLIELKLNILSIKSNSVKIKSLQHKLNKFTIKNITYDNTYLSEFINYLCDNWLFQEKTITSLKEYKKCSFMKDQWWKRIFTLENNFKQLTVKYMLNKKDYYKGTNVYDILGNYISTDGYQTKVIFNNGNENPINYELLEKSGYDAIKLSLNKLTSLNKTNGIYDINDVNLNNIEELLGKTLKGVDPGIVNVESNTSGKITEDIFCKSNTTLNRKNLMNSLKNTDQCTTNGEYQSSWFKGPFKVLENLWRKKYMVEKVFLDLSKTKIKTSDTKEMKKYINVLFNKNNYEKVINYKHSSEHKKWKYKRLLGKRSYVDNMTDNLAYGKEIKNYERKREINKGTQKDPIIIMFGAANFRTSMKNNSAVPRKNILKVLARKTLVLLVNEHNTSKCCCKCEKKLEEIKDINEKIINERSHKKWSQKDLRSVRLCRNRECATKSPTETFAIDRDTNASNNILFNGANVIIKNYLENNKNEKYLSGSKHSRSITG